MRHGWSCAGGPRGHEAKEARGARPPRDCKEQAPQVHPWKRHGYDGSDDRPRSASAMPVCVVSMLRRCLLFDGCVCYLFGENGNVLKHGNPSMACGDWRTVSSTTLNSCWTASAHKRSSNAGATISSCCNQQLDRVRPRKGSSSTIPHLLQSSRARRMWT